MSTLNKSGVIPEIARGDPITADWLNKVRLGASRALSLPGSVQIGGMVLQVPRANRSGTTIAPVKITTAIAGATIDVETGDITGVDVTVRVLKKIDGKLNARDSVSTREITVKSFFHTSTPDPGSGKWRFGYADMSRKELIQRECEVYDEPTETSS